MVNVAGVTSGRHNHNPTINQKNEAKHRHLSKNAENILLTVSDTETKYCGIDSEIHYFLKTSQM